MEGDLILGGLMMVHEREDSVTCGPVMPQGGIQALEAMLYTLDRLNFGQEPLLPNISLGAHILDDCDKDTYGLEMAVDFIKGMYTRATIFRDIYFLLRDISGDDREKSNIEVDLFHLLYRVFRDWCVS